MKVCLRANKKTVVAFLGVWTTLILLLIPLIYKSWLVFITYLFVVIPASFLTTLYLCAWLVSPNPRIRIRLLIGFITQKIAMTTLLFLTVGGTLFLLGRIFLLPILGIFGIPLFIASGIIWGWFVTLLGLPDGLGYIGGSTIFLAIAIIFSFIFPKTLFLALYLSLFKDYHLIEAIKLNYKAIRGKTYWLLMAFHLLLGIGLIFLGIYVRACVYHQRGLFWILEGGNPKAKVFSLIGLSFLLTPAVVLLTSLWYKYCEKTLERINTQHPNVVPH